MTDIRDVFMETVISKAKQDFGYNPKFSLKESVNETAKWYKKHGWI